MPPIFQYRGKRNINLRHFVQKDENQKETKEVFVFNPWITEQTHGALSSWKYDPNGLNFMVAIVFSILP